MTIRSTAIYAAEQAYRLSATRAIKTEGFEYHENGDFYRFDHENGYSVILNGNGKVDASRTKRVNEQKKKEAHEKKHGRAPYDVNRVKSITPQENGKNRGGEKETVATYKVIAKNPKFDATSKYSKRYAEPVTVRVYMARGNGSNVYASIWAHSADGKIYTAGNGTAGGYGYCKESASINSAFNSAGIQMQANFGGCGTQCAEIAILALAKKLGWKHCQIVKA